MTTDELIAELIRLASKEGAGTHVYVGVRIKGARWIDLPAVRVYVDRGRVFIDGEEPTR